MSTATASTNHIPVEPPSRAEGLLEFLAIGIGVAWTAGPEAVLHPLRGVLQPWPSAAYITRAEVMQLTTGARAALFVGAERHWCKYSTTAARASYTFGAGTRHSTTGAGVAHTIGAGAVYSTPGARATSTAGADAMPRLQRARPTLVRRTQAQEQRTRPSLVREMFNAWRKSSERGRRLCDVIHSGVLHYWRWSSVCGRRWCDAVHNFRRTFQKSSPHDTPLGMT